MEIFFHSLRPQKIVLVETCVENYSKILLYSEYTSVYE